MVGRVFALILCAAPVLAQQIKPIHSADPIDPERIGIYRDFLSGYNNGSGSKLNIANTTVLFVPDDHDLRNCLKVFSTGALNTTAIHSFSVDAFTTSSARLIDPKKFHRRDPGDAIKRGQSVEDAVRAGFAAGVFTFSEIVFDTSHTHAAFAYSFVCGRLCGSGGTVVYEIKDGKWRQDKQLHCGQWIS